MDPSLQANTSIPAPASVTPHDPETRLPSNANLIRLARLNPSRSSQDDHPSITLEVYDLDAQLPAYNALSYTWNDGNASNGETFSVFSTTTSTKLAVTANLYWALIHLRSQDEPRYLWIDQICIRQDDLAEKSHQIPLMGRIYREAPGGVIAWLGEYGAIGSVNYDHLLQYMSSITQKDLWKQNRYRPSNDSEALDFTRSVDSVKGRKSLIAFIAHTSWFTRVWIVQEASAQKERLLFRIGSIQFSFLDLCAVVDATNTDMRPAGSAAKGIAQHPDGRKTYFRFLRACPAIEAVGTGTHSLQSLVQTFCDWTASEPRDKVYAFLGLAKDAQRYSKPNYNLPVATVYREYAEVALAENTLPDVLSALTFAVLGETLEDQPSWVTNWASFQADDSSSQQVGIKSALWPARNNYKFLAGGKMGPLDSYQFSAGVLRLQGVHVDRVARVASEYAYSRFDKEAWLQEALKSLNNSGNEDGLTMADISNLLVMDGQSSLYQLTGHEPHMLKPAAKGFHLDVRTRTYRDIVAAFMVGRCLFVTEQGRVGAADARVRARDDVLVFKGSRLPFVVRRSTNQPGYRLISEAFIRGIMHGEAVSDVAEFDTISIV